jgi:hypothetical protein
MNPAKLLYPAALGVALLFTFYATAQTPPPATAANAAPGERFLVIVETSAAMKKRAENVQKLVGNLISTGLRGEMATGSTVGLWTFNDQLHTGQFPLQLWTPQTSQRVAGAMVQFLQQQKYEKTPRLATAWQVATNIVARSEHITVLIISSGAEPLTGTPFDAAIAESFRKNNDTQRKQDMPFLTILRAAQGKFVAFAVNMPPWPLEVPAYPDGLKPVAPAPAVETKPAPPAPATPRFDRTLLSPTNTIYLTDTSPPPAVPVIEPTPTPTNAAIVAPAPPPTPTNLPAPAPAPVVAKVEPVPMPQPEVPAINAPPPVPPAAEAPRNLKFSIVTILIAGIALLLVVLVVFITLLRWSRRSTGASLISRSMDNDSK